MSRMICSIACLSVLPMLAAAGAALAGPLDFYVGGAASRTDIRIDQIPNSPLMSWSANTNGWEVFVGWHPIPVLGAEVSYRDLGRESALATANLIDYTNTYTGHVHVTATTLQGLLYAPIPVPHLDLYAKAGLSHLNHHAALDTQCAPVSSLCTGAVSTTTSSSNETVLTLGAGAQFRLAGIALRAEILQDVASGTDPRQVLLGVAWHF